MDVCILRGVRSAQTDGLSRVYVLPLIWSVLGSAPDPLQP